MSDNKNRNAEIASEDRVEDWGLGAPNDEEDRQDEEQRVRFGEDANAPPLDLDEMLGRSSQVCLNKLEGNPHGSGPNWLERKVADKITQANAVLVPKGRRGDFGSRDYIRNIKSATAPLDPSMGVPSHFVSSRNGKTETGNQTKSQFIQEIFVSNLEKVKQAKLRAEAYDMMVIVMVPSIRDKLAIRPSDKFNSDRKNIFEH